MAKRNKKKKTKKKVKKKLKVSKLKNSKKNSKSHHEDELVFKVTKPWAAKAYVNTDGYNKKYNQSIKKNDDFWKKEGKRLSWIKPYK